MTRFPRQIGLLVVTFILATGAFANTADEPPAPGVKILALSRGLHLTNLIGKFDPVHGWVANDVFYDAPPQGAPFTLFGVTGKVAEVHSVEEQKVPACGLPWAWDVQISYYPMGTESECLAIRGTWPAPVRAPTELPLNNADAVAIVATYLKAHGLDVPSPRLTQVLQVDLLGDGQQALLITAQSQDMDLSSNVSVPQYSVALVRVGEKTIPAESYTELKPAGRTTEQQERLYGKRPHHRWITALDLNDDGRMEMVLRQRFEYQPHVEIFSLEGTQLKNVLSNYIVEDP